MGKDRWREKADKIIASGLYEKAWRRERMEEQGWRLRGQRVQLPGELPDELASELSIKLPDELSDGLSAGAFAGPDELRPLCYVEQIRRKGPVLLDIHGGGFVEGTAGADDELCDYYHRKLGIAVISLDYRKAPAYPYPTALWDIAAQIKWLCREKPWDISPEQMIIMGHSAGGNLAASYCLLAGREELLMPRAQVLDYPYLDLQMDCEDRPDMPEAITPGMMEIFRRAYDGGQGRTAESLMSPVLAKKEELEGLPPALLLTCGRDSLCLEGQRYGKLLESAGVAVTELYCSEARHGFIEHTFNSRSRFEAAAGQKELACDTVDRIARWIEDLWN